MVAAVIMLKLEKFVFYLFILTAPFQTRLILKTWHLSPAANFNEWTSAFFYGTDIVIIFLLILWFFRAKWRLKVGVSDILLFAFLSVAALSLAVAENKILGLYRFIKIAEFTALFFYVRSSLGKIFTFPQVLTALFVSGFFQASISIIQVLSQQSLGLKWLGESILKTNFSGVAVAAAEGTKLLRGYGTFPHPNVLAAWLFVSVFAFYFWYLSPRSRNCACLLASRDKSQMGQCSMCLGATLAPRHWTVLSIYLLILVGFLFTFSRVAIGLWLAGLAVRLVLVLIKRKKYQLSGIFKKRALNAFAVSAVVVLMFGFFYWPQTKSRLSLSSGDPAVSERIFYNKIAGNTVLAKPLLGIGTGQFVWKAFSGLELKENYLYQPVHNLYLLIAAENGIIGIGLFLSFVFFIFLSYIKKTKLFALHQSSLLILAVSVLVLGLFDHFLWTIQQGQIILWVTLALVDGVAKTYGVFS